MLIYNKEKHKQLVKRFIELTNEGRSLDRKNSATLFTYDRIVADKIYWTHREEFVRIFKNFLTNKMSYQKFEDYFSGIYWKAYRESALIKRDLERIESFIPNAESEQFSNRMTGIYRLLDAVDDGLASEQEVLDHVKETCLKNQIFKDELDIWL